MVESSRDQHEDSKLRSVIELASAYYWEQDTQHRFTLIQHWDSATEKALQRFIGKTCREMGGTPQNDGESWDAHIDAMNSRQPFQDLVVRHEDQDRGEHYVSISGRPVFDETGDFIGYRGITRDITSWKEQERLLRESEERYHSTMDLAAIGITHVAPDGTFLHANRQLCEMLGYTEEELVTLSVKNISHPEDIDVTDRAREKLRRGEIDSFKTEKRYLHKNGHTVWVSLAVATRRDDKGNSLYDISVVEDITARVKAEQRVQYLATHDEMTGLPNRTLFLQLLTQALESGKRYQRKFAVIFIDLDRFKQINDSLGHEAGDRLLVEMAIRLRNCLRTSDVVARLGGDEFVVLIQEVIHENQVGLVARNILSAAIQPMEIMGQECRVTASLGICMYHGGEADAQSLMKNADMAMYKAKEEGKNNYQFYSKELSSHAIEKITLETLLRRALEKGEFELHYQAKVNINTGKIAGVEALLRWDSAELGSITPARFIPLAEDMGLIIPIGKWVLQKACEQHVAWQKQGMGTICVSVNLSPRQFSDPDLTDYLRKVLKESGMDPGMLELEVTEGMIMHNADAAIAKLTEFKSLGVRVSIDDFGTGYSSLSQLKRFPVDTLKVDRSFIRTLPDDQEDQAITEAIITMGKTLGLTVIAEGVETEAQQEFLKRHACDEMQGFFFSKALPADQIPALFNLETAETAD